ncbi:MAG: DNA-binding protein Alba [Candidatus Micrarchaeota archaeon]
MEELPTHPVSTEPEVEEHLPENRGKSEAVSRTASSHGEREGRDPNTILVGKKPVMSYVLAVVTRFNNGAEVVRLKARGRNIAIAVDANQVVKNRFIRSLRNKEVLLSTSEMTREDGSPTRVSSMEIVMARQ